MRWTVTALVLALATALPVEIAPAQPQATAPDRQLGNEVRDIFAARCAGCHGPDLAKPKGRFGYVLELGRVAQNPELVIPSRPDESELWALVQRNEMPPSGPLTVAEKESIRAWIMAGAPDISFPASGIPGSSLRTEPSLGDNLTVTSPVIRAVRLMGKFHLLLLHFPIALLLTAGVAELLSGLRGNRLPSAVVQFCLTVAAVAIVPTVAFGWVYAAAGNGVGEPQLLAAHRWLGTTAGVWVLGTALCATRDARYGVRSRSVQVALAVAILLVIATAHAGGLMAHGSDFFDL